MPDWKDLKNELDLWHSAGNTAKFWWRDDDATKYSTQLDQLDKLSLNYQAPLSIAVIPAGLEQSLIDYVKTRQNINVLQHGYAHKSHAGEGVKKIEIGGHRNIAEIGEELANGLDILRNAFGDHFVPVLVPPWNRIEARVYPALQSTGFIGISSMWARKLSHPATGLLQTNTHLDPVNWMEDRGFIGVHAAIQQLYLHLLGRRAGILDINEPTGILTHHLDQTASVWEFCDQLFKLISNHPAAGWSDARMIWS